MTDHQDREPIRLGVALVPVVFLIGALVLAISVYGLSPHIPLIAAAAVAGAVAVFHGIPWKDVEAGMAHGINLAMGAILILMVVGTMIGTWILGGVVPTMIFYGLKILSPGIFLVVTMLICSIVSLGTGSSWSTAGTIGLALIGVGCRAGNPSPHGGGRHHLRSLLRRQDVAPVGHHESGAGDDRNRPLLPYPAHDLHDRTGIRDRTDPLRGDRAAVRGRHPGSSADRSHAGDDGRELHHPSPAPAPAGPGHRHGREAGPAACRRSWGER